MNSSLFATFLKPLKMSALNWVRDKAEHKETEFMTITAESAGEGTKPGLWRVDRWHFRGVLGAGMATGIRKELSKLVKVQSGDIQTNEVLRIGGQYRSEYGNCEF